MMINWKVRFKNPQFLFQLFLAIAVPIGAYFGISGADVTSWPILFNVLIEAGSNPFVIFTVFISICLAINDPTTKGFSDSKRALGYEKPNEVK